ncbi:hypothetical protein CMUS01_13637 [Colletotrichum musicola]|uniref:Uncharacterized protein n=1 Tax=Colletotrichum musicola TaxID=2175873 RepID=A0A8H6JBG5_9PEZI|nr:hypothetical protein CMUS01_13637 [Colletotrichum musicola]
MQAEKSALLPLNNAHQLFRSPGRSAGKGQSIEAFVSPPRPRSSTNGAIFFLGHHAQITAIQPSPVKPRGVGCASPYTWSLFFSFTREAGASPIPIVDGPSSLTRRFSTTSLPTAAIPHGLALFTSPGNASTFDASMFDASPLVLAFDLPAS